MDLHKGQQPHSEKDDAAQPGQVKAGAAGCFSSGQAAGENAEKVVSRMDIADKVWNTHFDTGTNFIDVYINYLRKKIDRDFDTKLIHTKTGMGFILTDKL